VGNWRLIGLASAIGSVCVLGCSELQSQPASSGGVYRGEHAHPIPPAASADGGRDRYVSPSGSDRAAGTRARPWRTLGHAAGRVRPGDTVHVAPGSYRGPLTIARGGTTTKRVRFVSDRRWGATIAARGSGSITVVEILADFVTFQGFEVTGRGGGGTAGIGVDGSHDSVLGNHVHRIAAPCDGNGGTGIVIGGGRNGYENHGGRIDGNLVENIGAGARDGSCRLVHGIYAAVPGVTIANNIVSRAAGDGITSWHAARALTIVNNLSVLNGGAGVLVGSGDSGATDAGHTDTLVANNIVYRNALSGIRESSDGDHHVGARNRYLNNLAFGNDGDADSGIETLADDATVAGTVSADPGFARPSARSALSYGLRTKSPAVDAGTRAGAPRHDFDGSRRPQGRGFDIGPHELPTRSRGSS
jgi:pectate disaccharide-lyase